MSYREILKEEFDLRSKRNPSYSLRAFAQALDFPVSKLSEVLRGKRGLSTQSAEKLSGKLQLSPIEKEFFIKSVESLHGRSQTTRVLAKSELKRLAHLQSHKEIELEKFKVITHWVHFAIMELTTLPSFRSDHLWISKRLKVETKLIDEAVERLLKLKLLAQDKKGRYFQTEVDLATTSDVPSKSIRAYHHQILELAKTSLEVHKVTERDFSSLSFTFDSERLDDAKKVLRKFRRKFVKDFSTNPENNRVYSLNMQLFPLDHIESNEDVLQ
jgi:uncharacterized protein (TIGR02147 family)